MAIVRHDIQTTQGWRVVRARPIGQSFFAYVPKERRYRKLRWALSHRGTGLLVGPYLRTLKACRLKVAALEKTEVNWMTLTAPKIEVAETTQRVIDAP